MDFLQVIWPIPGPVIAALVAGFISFVVTVLAKDQKTSEFRQAWIDGLRSDTAEFAGLASAMSSVLRVKKRRLEDLEQYLIDRHDDFAKMEALVTKIHLRLNPKEHVEIIELLRSFSSGKGLSTEQIDQMVFDVVAAIHSELGKEWRRVKRGEPSFNMLKWFSLAVAIAGVTIGLISAYQYFSA